MRIRTTAAALVAAAVLLAGCGSSSSPPKSNTESSKTSNTSNNGTTSTSGSSTGSSSSTSATTSGGSSNPATDFADTGNCAQLLGVGTKFEEAASALTGQGKTLDLPKLVEGYEELVEAAPEEIKPDVETIATAFTGFAKAVEEAHYKIGETPTAAQDAALLKASESFNSPEISKASTAISTWATQNCK